MLTLREQVIAPILAGVRSPRMGRKPATWTSVDRDYEKIRIDMQTLFQDLGIRAAGQTTSCRSGFRKRLTPDAHRHPHAGPRPVRARSVASSTVSRRRTGAPTATTARP